MDVQKINMHAALTRVCLLLLSCLFTVGCAGLMGHLGYWSGAALVDAEYDDLAERRVAVICVSDTSSYGAGTEERMLARKITSFLEENVEDIEVVPASEVADWVDKNDWDKVDYREAGKGVGAERVIAVDMVGFRLHQDLMYKGQADLTVTVFDLSDGGKEVFRRTLPSVTYPSTGYYSTSDASEATFRDVFLQVLAKRVAQHFFPYDGLAESTLDPASAG